MDSSRLKTFSNIVYLLYIDSRASIIYMKSDTNFMAICREIVFYIVFIQMMSSVSIACLAYFSNSHRIVH